MNRQRWMRTRRRLAAEQLPRLLTFGPLPTVEEIREGMAIVASPPGPELVTLPRGSELTYMARDAERRYERLTR